MERPGPRERARFWPSFLHVAALGIAFQIHASCLLLAVASVLLGWRRYFRVHWPGALLGGLLAAVPLVPWAIEVTTHPAIVTEASKGFPGRGLILVYPLARPALLAALRLALGSAGWTASISRTFSAPTAGWGPTSSSRPRARRHVVLAARESPSLAPRPAAMFAAGLPPGSTDRAWLKGYARVCFVAPAIVFSLAPTTIMVWQG